jgi:hypothetical protein
MDVRWPSNIRQMENGMEWNGIVQACYIQYSMDDEVSDNCPTYSLYLY